MTSPNPSERVARTLNGDLEGPNFSNPAELVTINVGRESKAFRVHKEVACLYSPVLRAAFNSSFIEGQTQTYTIDGCDEAFQLIVQWMYRQWIIPPVTKEEVALICAKDSSPFTPQDSENLSKINYRCHGLISAWLTADYLQIPRLQNYINDQIEQLRLDCGIVLVCWLEYLYEAVPRGAAIRQLIFEQCVRFIPDKWYKTNPHWFPKEFLVDHVIWDKRLQKKKQAELDPFMDRAEFKRRFHVPERER